MFAPKPLWTSATLAALAVCLCGCGPSQPAAYQAAPYYLGQQSVQSPELISAYLATVDDLAADDEPAARETELDCCLDLTCGESVMELEGVAAFEATAEQQRRFARGRFDDAGNRRRVSRAIQELSALKVKLPPVSGFLVRRFEAGELQGGRLELAARLLEGHVKDARFAASAHRADFRADQENEVRRALFCYLLRSCQDHPRAKVVFLSEGDIHGRDPCDSLMKCFKGAKLPIRTISQCSPLPAQAGDKATGEPGIILWVRPIKWVETDCVEVEAGRWEHGLGASGTHWRLVHRGGRWVAVEVLGEWVS